MIDTIWSTALHPKCKYPGSSLLSLLIVVHPAFMVHQVEAAWLKSEGPCLASSIICSIFKAFFPQPVCTGSSFCCLLITFSNTHLRAFVKNAPHSWKMVLWIDKDTTFTSLETLLLTHFVSVPPNTNSGVPEVHQQLLLWPVLFFCSLVLHPSYPNQVFFPPMPCFIFSLQSPEGKDCTSAPSSFWFQVLWELSLLLMITIKYHALYEQN